MVKKALIGLMLVVSTAAVASTPLEDFTRRAIQSLPVHHEDRDYVDKAEQLEAIAVAVAERAKNPPAGIAPKAWAALELDVAYNESGLSQRIIEHRCRPRECDSGLAKGLGQIHANSFNRDEWRQADGNIALQVKMLDDALRRAYWQCARSGVAFPASTLSGYAGQRCGGRWKGLDERVHVFNRLVAR